MIVVVLPYISIHFINVFKNFPIVTVIIIKSNMMESVKKWILTQLSNRVMRLEDNGKLIKILYFMDIHGSRYEESFNFGIDIFSQNANLMLRG